MSPDNPHNRDLSARLADLFAKWADQLENEEQS
jgi:hypothetical protein